MKFLYKVWSNYDGFTPAQLPQRVRAGGLLPLGWARYVDAVEPRSEVWVYFHGSHAFDNGVYAKGVVHTIDADAGRVLLRIRESSVDQPLTDPQTSAAVAAVVRARGLQVFLLPEHLDTTPDCDMAAGASTCRKRRCGGCPVWQKLPLVQRRTLGAPRRLPSEVAAFVPAYWVIAPRNFVYQSGYTFKTAFKSTTELFTRFKTGERHLAFPLALGIREALAERGLTEFDAVVPVPLSPEKAERGEIHRTRLLATELARLLGSRRSELLALSSAVSKRMLRGQHGYGAPAFEAAYRRRLTVHPAVSSVQRVLLVDDVCTEGSTLRVCAAAMWAVNADLEVVAATAGQMTVRAAVHREQDLIP